MTVLQVNHLNKSFADHILLNDLSFSLSEGERVGLAGVNGCGKTTLLAILAGQITPDSGDIQLARNVSVGLLSQLPDPGEDLGKLQVKEAMGEKLELAWQLNPDGFDQRTLDQAGTLSGGERTRLALGRFLANPPDIMLLDEPTNNLDLDGIQTVISLLQMSPGSMIIVSHDRYLLDKVVTRILEIDSGRIVSYSGNYSFYRDEKQRIHQAQLSNFFEGKKQQRRLQHEIQQKRQWSDKAHRDSTKMDASGNKMGLKEYKRVKAGKLAKKAKNDIRRLERLQTETGEKPKDEIKPVFSFTGQERHGKRILEATDLRKAYGTNQLFTDSNFYLLRGEKAALFGPNGCGKTTLISMIQGSENADGGKLIVSPGSTPIVMSQQLDNLPDRCTLLEYLVSLSGKLDGRDRATLAQLGFSPRQLQQPADRISPGERVRLRIAELVLSRRDFLILDEPTNYLDLHAREQLEDALAAVDATLLLVSHDIYLLKRICNKVLVFENGRIMRREASFAEYMDHLDLSVRIRSRF
jgi:macrolide transport system ATP-binding/permease protein